MVVLLGLIIMVVVVVKLALHLKKTKTHQQSEKALTALQAEYPSEKVFFLLMLEYLKSLYRNIRIDYFDGCYGGKHFGLDERAYRSQAKCQTEFDTR